MRAKPNLSRMVRLWSCLIFNLGLWIGGQNHASQLAHNLHSGVPQKVVLYGTSLTAQGAWIEPFKNFLNLNFPGLAQVINSGENGSISRQGLANIQQRVISHQPDTVFIEYAANDSEIAFRLSPSESRSNLEGMIQAINNSLPGTEIILMIMNPPLEPFLSTHPNWAAYNQQYREVASEQNLLLIDMEEAWLQVLAQSPASPAITIPDGIHPSLAGALAVTFPMIIEATLLNNRDAALAYTIPNPSPAPPPTSPDPVRIQKNFAYNDALLGIKLILHSGISLEGRISLPSNQNYLAHHFVRIKPSGEISIQWIPPGSTEIYMGDVLHQESFILHALNYYQESWSFRLPTTQPAPNSPLAGYAVFASTSDKRPLGLPQFLKFNSSQSNSSPQIEWAPQSGQPNSHIFVPIHSGEMDLDYPWFIQSFSAYYRNRFGANISN
ncbi:MAG: GDSL-type esterase/lipase family protein [Verrucomicrobia bacterium]|nr:GDSL-type esterase/lipase family protein [Verrucomicrobiota bacterium]